MINDFELNNEKDYLKMVFTEVQNQKQKAIYSLEDYKNYLKQQIEYSAEAFCDMDKEEIASTQTILENQELEIIKKENNLRRLNLIEKSAYFGRIDFNKKPYYIGISSLLTDNEKLYISDWRAPISSLYYDYELGKASYNSPDGEVKGEISKKRQYKVERDKLVYSFDSSLTINDDVLKEALTSGATQKMKNIVATIQKEQNKIIRSTESRNLIIQGEAGSGKTSIALHRAAYLLYKKAGKLTANDIMIISPNKLFSEYISNILPELGERNIIETSFNDLASKELPKIRIFNRDESINKALDDKKFINTIKLKCSLDFFENLKLFLDKFSLKNFNAQEIKFNEKVISKELIEELYLNKYKSKKVSVRIGWIADYITDELQLPQEVYRRILAMIYNMLSNKTILDIYAEFLKTQGIKLSPKTRKIYFEDAPALLYIKDYILGLENKQNIKYLIIDEMQDYNLIHYDIFSKLFDCNRLILGDINQDVLNIYKSKDLVKLCKMIGDCDILKLNKSYRSTYEISKFCQKIKGLKYNVVDRHGKEVQILKIKGEKLEINKILELLKASSQKRVAIICKTQIEAENYYKLLKDRTELTLIDADLDISADKIVISSANAKGIEFDVVIIPNVINKNYAINLDKNILYVSATRALHELYLTCPLNIPKYLV
ncbi:MAG: AAA family ATPase [Clostridia bacterium]|nr:AAA family ATPase [Clostridia bacterium]